MMALLGRRAHRCITVANTRTLTYCGCSRCAIIRETRHSPLLAIHLPKHPVLLSWAPALSCQPSCSFHLGASRWEKEPLKPSSKVEKTVNVLKEELGKKEKDAVAAATMAEAATKTGTAAATKTLTAAEAEMAKQTVAKTDSIVQVVPKTLWQRFVDELVHYYHGFRLLFIDINVCRKLLWRVLMGKTLTRREYRQLVRTTSDVFRLVPFSVFIIVPFMEFLLPVFLKLFPGMLPSTFQTASEREVKLKSQLKVNLETAQFLQRTLDEMALTSKGHDSATAKEFVQFFDKIRTSGEQATNEEIIRYSKLFEDEITLDALSRPQLSALCRVLEIPPIGTTAFLRFQLRMKLRNLNADDKMIQKEGVDTLTVVELQQACRARGMRAFGVPQLRLRSQLQQWLDLSLGEKVPQSLLLLSRTLYLPENIPATDQLKATISALPESVATVTKAAIGEREGKVEYKTRIEVIKEEEKLIQEERREMKAQEAKAAPVPVPIPSAEQLLADAIRKVEVTDKEMLVDTAPVVTDKAPEISVEEEKAGEVLSSKDAKEIEDALDNIGTEKLLVEKERLSELKAEMTDYQEDIEDLKQVIDASQDPRLLKIQESKAAKRLFKRVNTMITRMDSVISDLQKEENALKESLGEEGKEPEAAGAEDVKTRKQIVSIEELIQTLQKIQKVPDQARLERIADVLEKMDDDRDGAIQVDDVLRVIELIGKDNVQLTSKQMNEMVEMMDKEEILEMEQRLEKVLEKESASPPPTSEEKVPKQKAGPTPAPPPPPVPPTSPQPPSAKPPEQPR